MIEERWADEEIWWTGGTPEARRRMLAGAVMVFPEGRDGGGGVMHGGLMQGEAILAALDAAPRWETVAMNDRLAVETGDCVVLAYRAQARRPGGGDYAALCSSTWVRQQDGWRLVQHQQAPLSPAEG